MDIGIIKIGECQFDLGRHGVVRDGRLVHIEPRDFSVLLHLVEHAPNIVSARALLRSAWREKIVGDNALHQSIGRLRKILGDNARQPKYIQTQSKLGYQFIAPVQRLTTEVKPSYNFNPLAVLPFKDYSSDPINPYVVDGFGFELSNLLLQSNVQVVSLDRAARVHRHGFTDLEVGARVGAKTVLSGSLFVEHNSMRVNVQLDHVELERRIWSGKYEAPLHSMLQAHERLAAEIVSSIFEYESSQQASPSFKPPPRLGLGPKSVAPTTVNGDEQVG